MDRKAFYTTMLAISLGLYSCAQNVEPTSSGKDIVKTTDTPTETASLMDSITPIETKAPEIPYHIKGIDFTSTSFTLLPSYDLQKALGHVVPAHNLYADIPLPLLEFGFGTNEQSNLFEKSADDHSKGNPFFVVETDLNNHVFTYFHSRQWNSPGDLAREIGGFAYKNPDKIDSIIGQTIEIDINGYGPLNAEVVNIINQPTEFFNDLSNSGPWGVNESTGIIFARTDIFGIPNEIRDDKDESALYITIIGCQNKTPGTITDYDEPGAEAQNDAMRSLLTIKIKVPSK